MTTLNNNPDIVDCRHRTTRRLKLALGWPGALDPAADVWVCITCGLLLPENTEGCPTCRGSVELTPTGALVCREHGSDHYRRPHILAALLDPGSNHE